MNLTKRLERLEAQVRAQNGEDDSSLCRELIYDPRDWDIGKEEAISRMQADELVRLQISARQNSIFLSADIGPPRNYA